MAAKNNAELADAFEHIADVISKATNSGSPTYIETGHDPSADGYVTMVDELGDYMEIKSVDAITIEGEVYRYTDQGVGSSETKYYNADGTAANSGSYAYAETSYTFTKEVSLNTTFSARTSGEKDQVDLNVILITERDYRDEAKRDTLTVKIPAAMLPLRYYSVDKEEKLTIKETLPVRVAYSVGLLDSARKAMDTGDYSSVSGLAGYVAANTKNGQLEFYSNYFDGDDSNGDGYTDGNTYSSFAPSNTNPFYYYTEDTVFYEQSAASQGADSILAEDGSYYTPIKQKGTYQADLGGEKTVYYAHTYYVLESGVTTEKTVFVGLSVPKAISVIGITWNDISNFIGVNVEGCYYMKKGNAKLSLANDTRFIETKSSDKTFGGVTGTATTVLNPTWSSNTVAGHYETYMTTNYLGNNGLITFAGAGDLQISKNIVTPANLSPDRSAEFTFEITLTGGFTAGTHAYPASRANSAAAETVTFTVDAQNTDVAVATVVLKDAEVLTIHGLPAEAVYQVKEISAKIPGDPDKDVTSAYTPGYQDQDTTGIATGTTSDGIGTIQTGKTSIVNVANTYDVDDASVSIDLGGFKTLTVENGTTFTPTEAQKIFTFYLQHWTGAVGAEAWKYVTANGSVTDTKADAVTATATYDAGKTNYAINYASMNTALSNWQFTAPGEYLFRVVEENYGMTVNGIYHDDTMHTFTVKVVDAGDGTLSVASVSSSHGATNNWSSKVNDGTTTWSNAKLDFGNIYGTTKLTIDIDKTIDDTTGSGYNDMSGYRFDWKCLGYSNVRQTNFTGNDNIKPFSDPNPFGTTDPTDAGGVSRFSMEYDASDTIGEVPVTVPTISETGKHVYPTSNAIYCEYYEITEKVPADKKANIAYSGQKYIVEVIVTVNGGEITTTYSVVQYTNDAGTVYDRDWNASDFRWTDGTATITRPTGQDIIFENTYSDAVSVDLGAAKVLTGREWKAGDSFTFDLKPIQYPGEGGSDLGTKFYLTEENGGYTAVAGDEQGVTPKATATNAQPTSFGKITFTQEGTYYFTVTEKPGSQGGITYSNETYNVRVDVDTVESGAARSLAATVTVQYQGQISPEDEMYTVGTFTNTYTATPVSVTLGGKKTLNGRNLENGEFAFMLYDPKDELVAGARNAADGTYTFTALSFDTAGTYTYTVKENVPAAATQNADGSYTLNGVTYSKQVYAVKIVVSDNGVGQLSAAVYVDDNATAVTTSQNGSAVYSGLDFTNTYAAKGTLDLRVVKYIAGRDWQVGDSFTFALYDSELTNIETLTIAAPDNVKDGVYAIGGTFPAITYTKVGTHTYYVKEVSNSGKGITVDETFYRVTVNVTDGGLGVLNVAATYGTLVETGTGGYYEPANGIAFTNTYQAKPVKASLQVTKTLTGRSWTAADSFSFTLSAKDNAPMPASGKDTIIITGSAGNTAALQKAFDEIEYTKEGTYEYTITEAAGGTIAKGITYDSKTHTVTVVVSDNAKGQLVAAVTYTDGTETNTDSAKFVNSYSAVGSLVLRGTKTLEGRDLKDGEFKFTLQDKAGAKLQTVKNDKNGAFLFDALNYTIGDVTKAGEYITYYISEDKTGLAGIFYDETVYQVNVTVLDNGDGTLKVEIADYRIVGAETNTDSAKFVNSYSAVGSLVLRGTKTLEGRDLKDGEFKFTLQDKAGAKLQTVKNDKNGAFLFDALNYTIGDVTKAGEYITYYISEDKTGLAGIFYDETVYQVNVMVLDNGDGTLKVEIADYRIVGAETEAATEVAFTNAYRASAVSVSVEGAKVLTGRKLKAEEFSFVLTDSTGKTVETVKNDADGKFAFAELEYTKPGTYVYHVAEVNGDLEGITYDSKVYKVLVEVSDNWEGALVAQVSYVSDAGAEDAIIFNNTYEQETKDEVTPPHTGDRTNAGIWIALALISVAGVVCAILLNRKKGRKEDL